MMSLGYGGLGMAVMVISWLAIVGLAIWLSSALFPTQSASARHGQETRSGAAPRTQLATLNERYARGEISRSESEELRRALKA